MITHTKTKPIGAAPVAAETRHLCASPEFVDHRQARALFGLTRSHLYQLVDAGFIQSVSLRKPGKLKGRRLFVCQSIRDYLQGCLLAPAKGNAGPSRTVAELAALVARAALAEAKAAAGNVYSAESATTKANETGKKEAHQEAANEDCEVAE